MRAARLFLSQAVLDRWLTDGTADVRGDTLTFGPEKRAFRLKTAVLFEREVTGAGDPHELLGKVKDLDQLAELGGDYSAGSVVLGESAYEVIEGFTGEALHGEVLPVLTSLSRPPSALATDDPTAVGVTAPGTTSPGRSSPGRLDAAISAVADAPSDSTQAENELDLLARFFLEKR